MNALLLLLGGSGERFGGSTPKQFLEVEFEGAKRPLFEVTARKLFAGIPFGVAVFVAPEGAAFERTLDSLAADFQGCKMLRAHAGVTRYGSFTSGIAALAPFDGIEGVAVHDANRPYLSAAYLKRVKAQMQQLSPAAPVFIPVMPVVDSVVRLDGAGVACYESRESLKRVQTPQLLHYATFLEKDPGRLAQDFSDEGSLCLALGMSVGTFEGDAANAKITFPGDLAPEKLILSIE